MYLATPIRHVFADKGFAGRLVAWAATILRMVVEIVREPAEQRGFGWLMPHRRLAATTNATLKSPKR